MTATAHRTHRPTLTPPIVVIVLLCAGLPASVTAQESDQPQLLWTEVQQRGARLGGAADVDGLPGDELLIGGSSGGLYVARADGSVLWRYTTAEAPNEPLNTGGGIPAFVDDIDGDGRADVLAKFSGGPGISGAAVVLSGATGEELWRSDFDAPTIGRAVAADLDRDGVTDVVVPTVVDQRIVLRTFFGPGFLPGWSAELPSGAYIDPDGIDTGDYGDMTAVVVGTRVSGNREGSLRVLDGATGETLSAISTSGVFAATLLGGSAVTHQWRFDVEGVPRGALVAYRPSDGTQTWAVPLHGHIKMASWQRGDVDADGVDEVVLATTLYQEGRMPLTQILGPSPSATAIHAVGADGRLRWTHKVGHDAFQLALAPRGDGGVDVLYGTDNWQGAEEHVGLITGSTGVPVWVFERSSEVFLDAFEGVRAADLDGDGVLEVVATSIEQQVTALSMTDGGVVDRWSHPGPWTTAAAGDIDGDGRLDVVGGGADRLLRALEDGDVRWTVGNEHLQGPLGGTWLDDGTVLATTTTPRMWAYAVDAASGAVRWQTPTAVKPYAPVSVQQQAFGDVSGDGRADVVVGGAADPLVPSIVAIDGVSGAVLWRHGPPLAASAVGIVDNVGVVDGAVVATLDTITSEEETPSVVVLEGASGVMRWIAPAPGPSRGDATIALLGDQLTVASAGGAVSAYRWADGARLWTVDAGPHQRFYPLGDELLVANHSWGSGATFSGRLLDQSGTFRPVLASGVPAPSGGAVVPGTGFVMGSSRGVVVLDLEELRSGRAVVVHEAHLSAGPHAEYPVTEQVITGVAGGSTHAVGLADQRMLLGHSGPTRGVWVFAPGMPEPSPPN